MRLLANLLAYLLIYLNCCACEDPSELRVILNVKYEER